MLKKLFKYEFRSYNKLMLLCMGISAVLVAATRILFELMPLIPDDTHELIVSLAAITVAMSFYASAFALGALLMVPSIILAVSFYKKLVKDEGYLSFTLPVKNSDHLFCKTAVSVIWGILASIFAVLIASAAIFIGADKEVMEAVGIFMNEVLQSIDTLKLIIVVAEVLLLCLISVVLQAVSISFSISIGQLCKKYKLIGSIGAYLGLNSVMNFISTVIFYITMFSVIDISFETDAFAIIQVLILPPTVLSLVVSVVLYVISKRVITNRLNLE